MEEDNYVEKQVCFQRVAKITIVYKIPSHLQNIPEVKESIERMKEIVYIADGMCRVLVSENSYGACWKIALSKINQGLEFDEAWYLESILPSYDYENMETVYHMILK